MNPEVKALLDDLNKAFTDFRAANDERLKAIEKTGHAGAEMEAKVDRANAEITRLSAELKTAQDNIRDVETASARINAGGTNVILAERKEAAAFFAVARGRKNTTISDTDLEEYRAYKSAFEVQCRMGKATPNDVLASLQTGSDPKGGYWAPADTTGRIVTRLFETSPMRQIASVGTTSRAVVEGGTDLGEAGFGWVGETDDRSTNSDLPDIGEWSMPIAEMWANPLATQNDLDDSEFDVESWITNKVSDKFSRGENAAFVNGDGIKKPRGFASYPMVTTPAWGKTTYIKTGVSAGFAADDPGDILLDLIYGLRSDLRQGAGFVMNTLTLAAVRKLKDGQDNYLLIPDFSQGAKPTLLGYGVTEFADMDDIGANSYSIAYGNFREAYQIYDRQGIRVLRDPYTKKGYVQFYSTKRVGGAVVNFDALRFLKFGT